MREGEARLSAEEVVEWLSRYGRAWEAGDADAVVGLFDEEASYSSHVFRAAHVGVREIRAYWEGATATQEAVRVRFGRPLVDGDRVAVEWWATMRDEGEEITLPGCLLLRFGESKRCRALREYWHVEQGRREPPPGWGE